MKANILMKIAVVFMAAFGAYAFSGSMSSQSQFHTYNVNSSKCEDIVTAECKQSGLYICRINVNNQTMPLYDLACANPILHDDSKPLDVWSR